MTDAPAPTPPTLGELATRNRRRRMVRTVATAAISIGVIIVAGLIATDSLRPQGAEPSLAGPAAAADALSIRVAPRAREAGETIRRIAKERGVRPLTHEQPLRLLVAGDSISGGLGMTLGDLTTDTGIVDLYVDYRVGSGLFSGDRNWYQRALEDMATFRPETTVFMVGTNDAVVDDRFSDEEYAKKVGTMMDIFVGDDHHTVYWIGAPTLGNPDWDEAALRVNAIMKAEAAKRTDVVYLDAYSLFAGPDGGYSSTITDLDGTVRRMRSGDGVHLTNAGNQYFARTVFGLLDAQWDLTAQTVGGKPIGFTTAPGGGTAPGVTARDNSSTYTTARRYTSGTTATTSYVPTTTTTTVAPVTTATTVPVTTTLPPTTATTVPTTTATTTPPTTAETTTTTLAAPTP